MALLLPGCGSNTLRITEPWIPAAPPNVRVLAGYMTLENHTDRDLVLLSAASPLFESVEIHRTQHDGDVARMSRLPGLTIDAGQTVRFEANAYHLMLIGPKQAIAPGLSIPVTLEFENSATERVTFEVKRHDFKL